MYAAVPDPYCYLDSTVLKNRRNLRKQRDLDRFEAVNDGVPFKAGHAGGTLERHPLQGSPSPLVPGCLFVGRDFSRGADCQGRQQFLNCQAISALTGDNPF